MAVHVGASVILPAETKAIPMFCQECGEMVRIATPIGITTLMDLGRGFEERHAKCGRWREQVLDQNEKEDE